MSIDVEIGTAIGRSDYEVYRRKFTMPYIFVGMMLIGIFAFGIVSGFELLYIHVINLDIFKLKEIAIYGNNQVSASDILDIAKLQEYVGIYSVYSIMPHVVEKRIKSHFRYLDQVKIDRSIARDPVKGIHGLLTIAVKEREPVALVASGNNSFIVTDASGFALEELKGDTKLGFPYKNMPVILGVDQEIDTNWLESSSTLKNPLKLALEVVINARSVIPELIKDSYVDAVEPDDIILSFENRDLPEIKVRIASDRIREGLEDVAPVIARLSEERKETKYVDARFAGAVYCMGLEDVSTEGGVKVAQE